MTKGCRAGGGAGSRYPFLTSKERDIETGLDYFLARYYSSVQGRFTSSDEFTGGPDEYYEFTNVAAQNPTFYADLTDPQSLNKYQYAYNNPSLYIDPDGHQGVRNTHATRIGFYKAPKPTLVCEGDFHGSASLEEISKCDPSIGATGIYVYSSNSKEHRLLLICENNPVRHFATG